MVQEVVDTCPACNDWRRRGNKTIATTSSAVRFNEKVQHDLMFVEKQKTKEPDGSALLTGITRAEPVYIKRELFPANLSEMSEEVI